MKSLPTSSSWFLGASGFVKSKVLAFSLFSKIKEESEAKWETAFEQYVPWMNLKNLSKSSIDLLKTKPRAIETRPEILRAIAEAVSAPGDALYALQLDVVVPGQEIETGEDANILKQWEERASQGLELFFLASKLFEERFQFFGQSLIPLRVNPDKKYSLTNSNFVPSRTAISSHAAIGAIFRAIPDPKEDQFWRITFAIDLAHELAHQVLSFYQRSDRIISSPLDTPVYSSIMKKDRPSIMSFHAVAALVYMIEFVDELLAKPQLLSAAELEFLNDERKDYLSSLKDGLAALDGLMFTDFGNVLLCEFNDFYRAKILEYCGGQ